MSTEENTYEGIESVSEVVEVSPEVQNKLTAFYESANDAKAKLIDIINGISNESFRGLKIDDDFIGIMFVNQEGKLCDLTCAKVDEAEFQKLIEEVKNKQE